MGVSTDGQLCYGFVFEEDHEFPWDDEEKYPDGLEDWWEEQADFRPSVMPFTEEGEYAPGVGRDHPDIDKYLEEKRKWEKENPLPFEMVNYCSGECPMWILAVPESVITAARGFPEKLDFDHNVPFPHYSASKIEVFMKKYGIDPGAGPAWFLSSYWG